MAGSASPAQATRIESLLKCEDGVLDVSVDPFTERAKVAYDPGRTGVRRLIEGLRDVRRLPHRLPGPASLTVL